MHFFETQPADLDRAFLISDTGERVPYSELNVFCLKVRKHLHSRSLAFLLCSNTVGSVLGYVASLRAGVVPLLLDAHLDIELLQRLTDIYQPAYIWRKEEASGRLEAEGTSYESDSSRMVAYEYVFSEYGYTLWHRVHESYVRIHPSLALLLTTSGSTGSPKLVRLSYDNLDSNAASIAEYLELIEQERPITTLPMNYTYGLSVIHSHLLVGATVLLTERTLFEQEFWSFAESEQATSIAGVPYTYEMLKRLRFCRQEHPSIRTMTQAGGRLSHELQQEFAAYAQKYGKRFYIMYGQTEATARMSYLPYPDAARKIGSIGIPVPGGRFETDEEGNLFYYGENVFMGYAENLEDLAKGDESGGVLDTGDMARRDDEGYYYITGRKKRFLKIMGKRVNLSDAEVLLQNHLGLNEIVCTGNDEKMIIYLEDATVDEEEAISYISDKLGLNPRVFLLKKIDSFPRNESGKIQYKLLE